MANRFLVSGVQLAMLKGILKSVSMGQDLEPGLQLINDIIENQWVGNTSTSIETDVNHLVQGFLFLAWIASKHTD